MTPAQLSGSITALANLLYKRLSKNDLAVLSVVLVQLGDTLATLATVSEVCSEQN